MKDRNVVKASLDPAAKVAFDAVVEGLGMKQQEALGRLIRWFADQDQSLQILVLGLVKPGDAATYMDFLDRKFSAIGKGKPQLEVPEREKKVVLDVLRNLAKQREKRRAESEKERLRSASRKEA